MNECYLSFSFLSNAVRYIFGVIHFGIGFMAVFGNLFVFILLMSNRSFRTRSNAILASMATTDFLVGLVLQPLYVLQLFFPRLQEDCTFNNTRRMMSVILAQASYTSVALISYDRYTLLSKSLNYSTHMTIPKVTSLIILSWLIPMLMSLIKIVCQNEYVMVALLSTNIISSTCITLISYFFIIRITRKKQKEVSQYRVCSQRIKRKDYHIQAAKTVAIVLVCFFITTAPICIFNAIAALTPYLKEHLSYFTRHRRDIFYLIAVTCGLANSAINPLIYYAKIPEFRNQMRKMFKRLTNN